jgi:hypothetical protein
VRLAEEVHKFTSACERLLATAANSSRALTEDEARIVQYYCNELLEKMIPPSLKDGPAV